MQGTAELLIASSVIDMCEYNGEMCAVIAKHFTSLLPVAHIMQPQQVSSQSSRSLIPSPDVKLSPLLADVVFN